MNEVGSNTHNLTVLDLKNIVNNQNFDEMDKSEEKNNQSTQNFPNLENNTNESEPNNKRILTRPPLPKKAFKKEINQNNNLSKKEASTVRIFQPIPFASSFTPITISPRESAKSQMTPILSGYNSAGVLVRTHSDETIPTDQEDIRPLVVSEEKFDLNQEVQSNSKEEVIDTLLETLPSGRRLDVTPQHEEEEENKKEISLVHETTIDNLLHTLPSGRRLEVTPDASDDEENNETPEIKSREIPMGVLANNIKEIPSHESPPLVDSPEIQEEIFQENSEEEEMIQEESIDNLLETLPNTKRPEITPKSNNDEENEENKESVNQEAIDNLLETLPNTKRPDITPEILPEEQSEINEEHINTILETLPSGRRLVVTPSMTEEEESEEKPVNEENIDTILQTLPANRRLVVTPEIIEDRDNDGEISEDKIDILLGTLQSTRRLDVTPSIEQEEDGQPLINQDSIDNLLNTLSSSRRLDVTPENEPNDDPDSEENIDSLPFGHNVLEEKIEEVDEQQTEVRTRELSINDMNLPNDSQNEPTKLKDLDLSHSLKQVDKNLSEDEIFVHTETKSSKVISPQVKSSNRKSSVSEEDSSDDEQREQDQQALEKFSKTGRLPPMKDKASILREVQRERADAIEIGDYDRAQQLYDLSKKVQTAIYESDIKERKEEKRFRLEEQLEKAKAQLGTVKYETKNVLRRARETNEQRIEEVKKKHIQELEEFQEKWNNEDYLRKFSKPSSELLALKDRERRFARAKLFNDAKTFRQKANQQEIEETKTAQERAYHKMKFQKSILLQKQAKEMEVAIDSANKNYEIVQKKRKDMEDEQIRKIEAIQKRTQDGVSIKIGYTPTTARAMTSMSATRKIIGLNRNPEIPKLEIKKLGAVTAREKRKIEVGPKKEKSQFPSL